MRKAKFQYMCIYINEPHFFQPINFCACLILQEKENEKGLILKKKNNFFPKQPTNQPTKHSYIISICSVQFM